VKAEDTDLGIVPCRFGARVAVRLSELARRMVMQAQALAMQTSDNTEATLLGAPLDLPVTENQMTELRETWLQHQINPARGNETPGVPYSPLND
jgi:hypothetical protein